MEQDPVEDQPGWRTRLTKQVNVTYTQAIALPRNKVRPTSLRMRYPKVMEATGTYICRVCIVLQQWTHMTWHEEWFFAFNDLFARKGTRRMLTYVGPTFTINAMSVRLPTNRRGEHLFSHQFNRHSRFSSWVKIPHNYVQQNAASQCVGFPRSFINTPTETITFAMGHFPVKADSRNTRSTYCLSLNKLGELSGPFKGYSSRIQKIENMLLRSIDDERPVKYVGLHWSCVWHTYIFETIFWID